MADRDEAARLISEAQEATSSGDHRAAERALRLALRLQEEQFDLVHPEVVGTLDSLGVVCSLLGRPDEAEYLHRRALGIAKKTLGADHPSVAASLRNLSNLYAAQGKPGRLQVVAGGRPRKSVLAEIDAEGEQLREPLDSGGTPQPSLPVAPEPVAASVADPRSGPSQFPSQWGSRAALALAGAGVVLSILWFMTGGHGSDGGGRSDGEDVRPPAAGGVAAASVEPAPTSGAASGESDLGEVDVPPPFSEARASQTGEQASSLETSAVVAHAAVCRELVTRSDDGARLPAWRCDPVLGGTTPGQLFFYTRVRSPASTTVEYRWYREGALDQVVALEISANDGPGYRTYSVRSVTPWDRGKWRVEVRSADAELLHAEDFVVR